NARCLTRKSPRRGPGHRRRTPRPHKERRGDGVSETQVWLRKKQLRRHSAVISTGPSAAIVCGRLTILARTPIVPPWNTESVEILSHRARSSGIAAEIGACFESAREVRILVISRISAAYKMERARAELPRERATSMSYWLFLVFRGSSLGFTYLKST